MEPKIIGENTQDTVGIHNNDLDKSIERVEKSMGYEDLSTIIICPTRGMFPTRVVQSWMKLMKPMNQLVAGPIFAEVMKVDDAYNSMIKYILDNPYLSKFKYILTIEEDNIPPADGLLKLYEGMKDYDVVGGLYWTKSDEGMPMIYGDPNKGSDDASPQTPIKGKLQHCNALGMGFNLFKLDMFKKMEGPWFKTVQEVNDYGDETVLTQDFYFYKKAAKEGYKFACNPDVAVGYFDSKTDKVY